MICGTSNTGKSTLAFAIGRKLGLPVVHLDQLRHLPNTDWQERPDDEFHALHNEAVLGEHWVMDGNYSRLFPQRIPRATGIIFLRDNRWANFRRYLVRTLFQKNRIGNLEGNRDSLKWDMIRWVLVSAPRGVRRYRTGFPKTGLPYLEVRSMKELNALYSAWGLSKFR